MDLVEHQGARSIRHPWETARLKIVKGLIEKLPEAPATLRVLDVGAGDGFAINALTEQLHFAQATAQDSNYSAEWLQQLQGGAVRFVKELTDLQGSNFDLALFLDVIEHVADDAALLRDATTLLRPQGWVLITVPAFNSLFSEHDRLLKHHRRYSRRQLLATVAQADLACVDSGYFFFSLLAPRLLRLVGERFLKVGAAANLGQWQAGPGVTALVTGALAIDDGICRSTRALGLTLPGLSCWALCQKR
jgi:SAM-dependent methyltransferase